MDYHLDQQFLTKVGIKFKDVIHFKYESDIFNKFLPCPTTPMPEKLLSQNCEQENIPLVSFCIVITML
jgi:hypothetical protein